MDRQSALQEKYAINAEEHFLQLKTIDELQDILADEYGIEPPSEKWFRGKMGKYKNGLIKLILSCKFGTSE